MLKHSRKGYKMISKVHRHGVVENPVPGDRTVISLFNIENVT